MKNLPEFDVVGVLLREEEIALGLRQAFQNRYLDEKYFYWLPTSVEAWVRLCRSSEYRNADRAIQVLTSAALKLLALWSQLELGSLCGLGCGEGSKDIVLLRAFSAAQRPLIYVAVDFSQPLLELALATCRERKLSAAGFKLDVMQDEHLEALLAASGAQRSLITVLGNTLGAFGPREFPARLRRLLSTDDRVLFDGEIFAGAETLAGYDNPVNRRFAWGPLHGVGIGEEDGELVFATEEKTGGLHEVTKHFIARRDLRIHLGGETIAIAAGEKLRMSSSIKYASEAVLLECIEQAGFVAEHVERSADQRFALVAARPS